MVLALLLAASGASTTPRADPKPKALSPPRELRLPALPGSPLIGPPSFTPNGDRLLFARFAPDAPLSHDGRLWLVGTAAGAAAETVAVDGPNHGGDFQPALSRDGRRIAYLAGGELWVRAAPGSSAAPREPTRLYPPKEGGAPLGEGITHVSWSRDGTWLLLQSPRGWARVEVEKGELAPLTAPPLDLTGGSLVLGLDGVHAAFVRPRSGPGWQNGARIVVLNTETGRGQLADFDNDYVEVLLLPDGQLLGEDGGGALWSLHGRQRTLYFRPPPAPSGATIGSYAVSPDARRIAYVVTQTRGGLPFRCRLFSGVAPALPPWPKPGH